MPSKSKCESFLFFATKAYLESPIITSLDLATCLTLALQGKINKLEDKKSQTFGGK